jgi:hypothetical protein
MRPLRFRIRAVMIAVLFAASYVFLVRIFADVHGIYRVSAGLDTRNVPALFLHFDRRFGVLDDRKFLRGVTTIALDKAAIYCAPTVAVVLLVTAFRRAARARRDRLDRQFAMRDRIDSEFRGNIRRLAEFTGSRIAPSAGRSGERDGTISECERPTHCSSEFGMNDRETPVSRP